MLISSATQWPMERLSRRLRAKRELPPYLIPLLSSPAPCPTDASTPSHNTLSTALAGHGDMTVLGIRCAGRSRTGDPSALRGVNGDLTRLYELSVDPLEGSISFPTDIDELAATPLKPMRG